MRKKIDFNDNWLFQRLDYSESALGYQNTLDNMTKVCVPHDAVIEDADYFYKDVVVWYKKKINITPESDRRYIAYFEGVYMDSSVWVNGKKVFEWPYGFTAFSVDLTEYISSPDDEIAVRIVYQNPNSRWYAGPGIIRNVWLYDLPLNHIVLDSLASDTRKEENFWTLETSVEIENESDDNRLEMILKDDKGEIILKENGLLAHIDNPVLWDVDNPYLYSLVINLYSKDELIDSIENRIGFRKIDFTNDKGLFVNDKHVKLNGVCLHSDLGAFGHAFHRDLAKRQILLMKEMGVNAIRTSHNPPAPEFLDICDEEGILVMDEILDMWKLKKTTYDYARFYDKWHEKDVASWIRRDRNHPCIIMWSVGNEIYDTHNSAEGRETMLELMRLVKKHDKSHARPTLCSNYMEWDNTMKCADDIKLIGYNYTERLYESHHKAHPDWYIYGSETASCVQSRGIYHFPLKQSILADDDLQCSSLGNSTTSWGARKLDDCVTFERDTEYSLGQFMWTGTDYIGEPTPYHTKNSYFGMADTAGFPKDAYFMFKSAWNKEPMIHLLPYWDFNPGQTIDVRICSSFDKVELFANGESLGIKTIDHANGKSLFADYKLAYIPGSIEAKAYDESDNCIVSERRESFGDVESLRLSADTFTAIKDKDNIFVTEIEALDKDGHLVENANCRVKVNVTGAGKLVGLDNGDSTDYDSYKGDSKRLFSGKLLAMIRSDKTAGEIKVSVSLDESDIPVRKLELTCDKDRVFSPNNNSATISAKVFPANAKYSDIIWQITNDSGVEISQAVIEEKADDNLSIKIKAVGDGEFRVRALVKDESGKVIIISVLDFEANGFGEMCLNPYKFISGSLYTVHGGNVGNGNERGVSTAFKGSSWVAFEKVDFGNVGSKKLAMPIFELSGEITELIFWKGVPYEEGSYVCGKGTYLKPSIWNVYQEDTFELDEVLKGIQTFGIELNKKIHIKGFEFKPYNKAWELNKAYESDEIYGDSYVIKGDVIEGIGNNVSIVFDEMNFDVAPKSVTICGKTSQGDNTIHILFEDESGVKRQIVEFKQSDSINVQSFELEAFTGKGKVTFLFLPGSHFDFKWFKFI